MRLRIWDCIRDKGEEFDIGGINLIEKKRKDSYEGKFGQERENIQGRK